ncbi:MAG: hypothetical protein ACI8RZ_006074 [Myxococcota bacterium]|jgi:hypothetical protein
MNRNVTIWTVVMTLTPMLLLGCTDKDPAEDDDEEPALILGNPTDTDGFSPYVSGGEMICNPGTTSPDTLNVVVQVGDPQGSDTIDSDGIFAAYDSSGEPEFDDLLMPCNTSGVCTAGFTVTTYPGLDCSSAVDYTFFATVYDEEGNVSEPVEIPYNGR